MPLLVITTLGAALRLIGIGHQGFWYDEAYTSFLLKYSPGQMLGLLPHLESTPPLYYSVAWVWARVFGNDPAGLRSLSALFGIGTIPVAYLTALKMLANRRSALIAACLVAFNPLLIWYSQEARAYSMLVLTSALTLLAFAYARERPHGRILAAWALACALALGTHYYAGLVVLPEAAWMLYEHRHRRAVRFALGAVALAGLALLPLLVTQIRTGNDNWIAERSIGLRLSQMLPLFLIGTGSHLRELVKYLAFAAALTGVAAFIWRSRRRERQGGLLPGGIALAGFLIAATVGETTLLTRNLLAIMVPLALFLAAGLGASRARLVGLTATTVLCGVGAFATLSVASDHLLERPNWTPLAAALSPLPASVAHARGTRLVIVMNNPGLLPLGLYMNGLKYVRSRSIPDVTVIDMVAVSRFHGQGNFCWWGAACNLMPSKFDRHFLPAGFRVVGPEKKVEQFRVIEMVATRPRTLAVASLPTSDRREVNAFVRNGHGNLNDAYLIQAL